MSYQEERNGSEDCCACSNHPSAYYNNRYPQQRPQNTRPPPPPPADNTDFYVCECTQCRNLGNSLDVCCQCCACSEHQNQTGSPRRYQVSSMALTGESDDTLEICLNDYEDEIAMEHHRHHLQQHQRPQPHHCLECEPTNPTPPCCNVPPMKPAGHPHAGRSGWSVVAPHHHSQNCHGTAAGPHRKSPVCYQGQGHPRNGHLEEKSAKQCCSKGDDHKRKWNQLTWRECSIWSIFFPRCTSSSYSSVKKLPLNVSVYLCPIRRFSISDLKFSQLYTNAWSPFLFCMTAWYFHKPHP